MRRRGTDRNPSEPLARRTSRRFQRSAGRPVPSARGAVEALLRALGLRAEYFLTPTEFAPVALATIASAYAPLLKQAHDALAEAIDCIRVFHGSGTAWDIYESCSPEMKQIKAALAALREDKHEA